MAGKLNEAYLSLDEASHPVVSFSIHCARDAIHTLVLSHRGDVVLSHHANPQAEITLTEISGARRLPQCLRWWRALEGDAAWRERLYDLARQGINALERLRVTEDADGRVTFQERPAGQKGALTLAELEWAMHPRRGVGWEDR